MPFDPPPVIALPPSPWRKAEWRTFRLRDELDDLNTLRSFDASDGTDAACGRCPLSSQARAILDWPSSRLDYWVSAAPQLLGGLRQIEITPEVRETLNERAERAGKRIAKPRRTLHRVTFQTMEFMIWLAANQN
jgi:hypothetical protein